MLNKMSQSNIDALEILFTLIEKQSEFKQIYDHLGESIIIFEEKE